MAIAIREIDHIVLRVVELDAMIRFYCDVLGCRIERRQDAIGLVQLRAGACAGRPGAGRRQAGQNGRRRAGR